MSKSQKKKSSKVTTGNQNTFRLLAIIGIIIGAAGLGTGIYSIVVAQTTDNTVIKGIWMEEATSGGSTSTSDFELIADLSIIITVNAGETVYVIFKCDILAYAGTYTGFRIYQDGVNPSPNILSVVDNDDGSSYTIRLPVVVQGQIEGLSAGTYNISAVAWTSTGSSVNLYYSSLYIHTFV